MSYQIIKKQDEYRTGVSLEYSEIESKKDGMYIERTEHGVRVLGFYRDDKPHGIFLKFSNAGRLLSHTLYNYGEVSTHKEFYDKIHSNGEPVLKIEYPYENGFVHGTVKLYRDDGVLDSETPYNLGVVNGTFLSYYESGRVKHQIPYVQGEKHGLVKFFYDRDEDSSEPVVLDGVSYIPEDNVEYDGEYSRGVNVGIVRMYWPNSKIQARIDYSETGDLVRVSHYFETGLIKQSISYQNNLKNGDCIEYYDLSKLEQETLLTESPEPRLKIKSSFVDDVSREVNFYYEDGSLMARVMKDEFAEVTSIRKYDPDGTQVLTGSFGNYIVLSEYV